MNKRIKIVWLCPFAIDLLIPAGLEMTRPQGGHSCSWIINWAQALAKIPEVDLHIITYSARIKKSQSIQYMGYAVHVLRENIPLTDKSWGSVFHLDAVTGFQHRSRKFLRKIAELQPDVVHGHGTEDAYGVAAVQCGIPNVVSIQGVMADYQRTNPCSRFRLTAITEEVTVREGHYFMCRTHFDKGFVKKLNPRAHIFHMPEPMNPHYFSVDRSHAEPFRILHVGGYDPRKGLEDLLVAVAQVKRQYPEVLVDVVGNGSPRRRSYIAGLVGRLGLDQCVTFHGFLSAERIAELHARATVFVITSQNENSPNTLAEALCAGTPCVAYDVGGISSMFVDGESGFLIPAGETDLLVGKISQVLTSPELGQQFSNKSREDGIANHPDHVADASFNAYSKILEECGT